MYTSTVSVIDEYGSTRLWLLNFIVFVQYEDESLLRRTKKVREAIGRIDFSLQQLLDAADALLHSLLQSKVGQIAWKHFFSSVSQ